MNEQEFEILDELYFMISYADLKEEVSMEEADLIKGLKHLVEMDFVRCYQDMEKRVEPEDLDFDRHFASYCYLASKQGLIAHNTA